MMPVLICLYSPNWTLFILWYYWYGLLYR